MMVTIYQEEMKIEPKALLGKMKEYLFETFKVNVCEYSDNVLYFSLPIIEAFVSIELHQRAFTIYCPSLGIEERQSIMNEIHALHFLQQFKKLYDSLVGDEKHENVLLLMITSLSKHKHMRIKITPYRPGVFLIHYNGLFRLIDTYDARIINNILNQLLLNK